MGLKKDRNGMDLTEAEDIRKRRQEYTEELYKKELHDPDNHDGVQICLPHSPIHSGWLQSIFTFANLLIRDYILSWLLSNV